MATQQRSNRLREGVAEPSEKTTMEIVGGRGRGAAETLREVWDFRDVQVAFALRQLKVRYRQTFVGAGWAVLQPVVAAAIFALFLGRYADIASEGVPYLVFALVGTAAWGYFSRAATTGAESVVANGSLIRKIYFPREILPLTAVWSGVIDLVIGIGVVVVVAAVGYGITPDIAWVAIPLPALVLVVFAAALALALAALNIYYRDVRYVLPFMLQVALFASPIVYPLALVPEAWRVPYAILNPIAAAVDSLRRVLLHGEWPEFEVLVGALGWSIVTFLAAYALFKRLERGFADRV